MVKIAIVGGRDFNNYVSVKDNIFHFLYSKGYPESLKIKDIKIISGGARGADSLAEIFANQYGFKKEIFKPDWELFGKRAGFLRNIQIIDNADIVVAFWDGKSKGTKHSIDLAKQKDKELYIVRY